MEVFDALMFVLLGTLLGAVGQGARTVVGLKKAMDRPISDDNQRNSDWFDARRLVVSLLIGAIAGSLGAVTLLGTNVDKSLLVTLVATGYAGTDFIEGFMKTRALKNPKRNPKKKSPQQPAVAGGSQANNS